MQVQMGVSEEQRGLLGRSGLILWRRRYFLLGEYKHFWVRRSQGKWCSHAFSLPLTALLNKQHHQCPQTHPVSLAASPQVTSWGKNCSCVVCFSISQSIATEPKSGMWTLLSSPRQETVLREKVAPLDNPMFPVICSKELLLLLPSLVVLHGFPSSYTKTLAG